MIRCKFLAFALLFAALALAVNINPAHASPPEADKPVAIGMVKSFFNDVPDYLIKLVTDPFGKVMKQTTGVDGKLLIGEETFDVVKQLQDKKLQLGVFHGHEFAWAKKADPSLVPLVVVVNEHHDVRAWVVVHKNSPAKSLADLRNKVLDMPKMTKEHCRLFLEKNCTDNGQCNLAAFARSIKKSDTGYDGLDDVCLKKLDAVVVDTITLEFYKQIKKAVYNKNLRVLAESQPFPAAVIAYRKGALNPATANKIRAGLLNAHKNDEGRALMELWQIAAFEAVPANYGEHLANVLKRYPPPVTTKVSLRR